MEVQTSVNDGTHHRPPIEMVVLSIRSTHLGSRLRKQIWHESKLGTITLQKWDGDRQH